MTKPHASAPRYSRGRRRGEAKLAREEALRTRHYPDVDLRTMVDRGEAWEARCMKCRGSLVGSPGGRWVHVR